VFDLELNGTHNLFVQEDEGGVVHPIALRLSPNGGGVLHLNPWPNQLLVLADNIIAATSNGRRIEVRTTHPEWPSAESEFHRWIATIFGRWHLWGSLQQGARVFPPAAPRDAMKLVTQGELQPDTVVVTRLDPLYFYLVLVGRGLLDPPSGCNESIIRHYLEDSAVIGA
jgi:hypothetical protein